MLGLLLHSGRDLIVFKIKFNSVYIRPEFNSIEHYNQLIVGRYNNTLVLDLPLL
jgi:hypothetical protein